MLTTTGNLWETYSEVKVIPTNGVVSKAQAAVMGAGVALQAAQRWPMLPVLLGERIKAHGNTVQVFQVPWIYQERTQCDTIVTFPTKHNWQDKAHLNLVAKSTVELRMLDMYLGWQHVLLPEVGMGLGGLTAEEVYPILNLYLNDHFTLVKFGNSHGKEN